MRCEKRSCIAFLLDAFGRATQEEGFLAIGPSKNLDLEVFADAAPIRFVGDFSAEAAQFGARRAHHNTPDAYACSSPIEKTEKGTSPSREVPRSLVRNLFEYPPFCFNA
jgi:hypothetical protein